MLISLTQAAMAVGALGTAATGLVDTTKAFFEGGMSRVGFGYIRQLLARTVVQPNALPSGLSVADIEQTLLANWMNGMDTGAQKAIARSFIKMHLNPTTAKALALQTNVDATQLLAVAEKLAAMVSLAPAEADAYGRFDFAVSALVDRAYERADQYYRNSCKALAAFFAVVLALAGDYSLSLQGALTLPYWQAFIIGLVATPLAPVAKDIANAIQTASDAIGKLRG